MSKLIASPANDSLCDSAFIKYVFDVDIQEEMQNLGFNFKVILNDGIIYVNFKMKEHMHLYQLNGKLQESDRTIVFKYD